MIRFIFLLILTTCSFSWSSSKLAKVTYIEGVSELIKNGRSKPLKVNMILKQGNIIKTGENSQVELTYFNGDVVRLSANSELQLEGREEGQGQPKLNKGNLWSNIKKLSNSEPRFQVKTSVATAAVRGTTFLVSVQDSSASIHLLEGKIDVGPNQPTSNKAKEATWGPPVEIEGPKEVTLDEWISLDPGQMIEVNWDGSYRASEFKTINNVDPRWLKMNQDRDKLLKR